jgi:hypothetical protein
MIGVIAHLVLLGTGVAASLFFPNRDAASRSLTLWGWLEKRENVAAAEAVLHEYRTK